MVVNKDDIPDLANKSNIDMLKELPLINPENILFACQNISSARNRLENFCGLLANKVGKLAIAETKLDVSNESVFE